MPLASIEKIIEDAKAGKMFILVDDENRENEGDLVIPASLCDDQAINFMARFGRGLICLTLDSKRVETLGLGLMAQHNRSRHQTAFTASIEARVGVTTGISAADRATTVAAAIDETQGKEAIVSPGHIFPLIARDGGVLVRAGHTEAAVDISRLAGLNPSGVICEIMNDDGTMARLPDLVIFAKEHGLNIATIADLIAYRHQHDNLVKRELETTFESKWGGEFDMVVYSNTVEYTEHVALIKGEIDSSKPVQVRVHALDVLSDVLGDAGVPATKQNSMQIIAEEGGILLLIRETSPTALTDRIKRKTIEQAKAPSDSNIRDYGIGAQILLDLGVREMVLISNSERPIVGLEGYGLKVVGYRKTV
jgi:3,4-dihydroxy 2-butanone 4-phosphate synthase/GTP cyclohydrolase II